jgi:hypothetical protein
MRNAKIGKQFTASQKNLIFSQKCCAAAAPFLFFQLLEYAVWLDELFELSNSFEATISLRIPVVYSYFCGDSEEFAKLRRTKVRKARGEYTVCLWEAAQLIL